MLTPHYYNTPLHFNAIVQGSMNSISELKFGIKGGEGYSTYGLVNEKQQQGTKSKQKKKNAYARLKWSN